MDANLSHVNVSTQGHPSRLSEIRQTDLHSLPGIQNPGNGSWRERKYRRVYLRILKRVIFSALQVPLKA